MPPKEPFTAELAELIAIRKALTNGTYGLATLQSLIATIDTVVDAIAVLVAAKVAGRTQIHTKQITSAANAGDVTVATATTQPVLIKSLTVRSNGATTSDLTSISVYAATSKRVTLIDPVDGAQANLDATGKQVVFPVASGPVYLAVGETIVMTLAGAGATPVDLQVVTECEAVVDGGYLA